MLKGIDPLLHADLLYVLAAMGHGDEIAIVDRHFPAVSLARRVVRLDGVSAPRALDLILSVLPLDELVDAPATCMEVAGRVEAVPPVCQEFQRILDSHAGERWRLGRLDRVTFYDRVRAAFAVVITGETRSYGNILLTKGVLLAPEDLP